MKIPKVLGKKWIYTSKVPARTAAESKAFHTVDWLFNLVVILNPFFFNH